jgi:hypothetical protein
MKRTAGWVAMTVVAAGVAGACAQTSNADVTRRRVNVVVSDEKAATLELVDGGDEGFGPGDQLVEQAPLIDSSGKTVGQSYTTVAMVRGGDLSDAHGLIDCHIVLSGGTILFNGAVSTKDLGTGVTLPVIGGTGTYAGAGGSVRMVAPNDKRTNLTFDLLIPKTS